MKVTCLTDRSMFPVNRTSTVHLLVEIGSGASIVTRARPSLNICLVLDRSHSMRGEKMFHLKQTAKELLSELDVADRISIVTYSDSAKVVVKPQSVKDKSRILRRIEQIEASGRTNLSAGWTKGSKLAESSGSSRTVNRVLLMSDGFANEGVCDPLELAAMVQRKRKKQVLTTALGFGTAFDEDLLVALAVAGGGNFYYIAKPADALPAFAKEIKGLTYLAADDVTVCVQLSPNVQFVKQLNDYDVITDDNIVRTVMGGMFHHQVETALFELAMPPPLVVQRGKVADVWVEYIALDEHTGEGTRIRRGQKRKTASVPVHVNYTDADIAEAAPLNMAVVKELELMRVAQGISAAKVWVNKDDFETAMRVLAEVQQYVKTCNFSQQRKNELIQLLAHFAEELQRRENLSHTGKVMTTTLFNLQRNKLFAD